MANSLYIWHIYYLKIRLDADVSKFKWPCQHLCGKNNNHCHSKANNNHCHSNAIANPSTQTLSFWPMSMCDEELTRCYYCTRRQRFEARSMLVELQTRISKLNESGSIGSSFLWGCPLIKLYCGSRFRMVLDD